MLAQWLPTLYLCWHSQAVSVGQAVRGCLCQWLLKIPAGTVSASFFQKDHVTQRCKDLLHFLGNVKRFQAGWLLHINETRCIILQRWTGFCLRTLLDTLPWSPKQSEMRSRFGCYKQEMHFSTFLLPCPLAVQNFECGWKLAAAGWVLLSKKEEGPGAASLNCIAPAGSHLPAVRKGASGGSHRVPSKVSLEHLLGCMELSLQRCCTVCVQPSGDFWEMKGHHENPMSVADVLWLSRCWEWALLRASEKWSELGSDTCTSKLSCSGRVLQYGKLSSHVETSILVCIS